MITYKQRELIRKFYFRDFLTITEISARLCLCRNVVARVVGRIRREGRYDYQ